MIIDKIYIKNYKSLREYTLPLNEDLNLLVGDNEVGKSTVLEAINLALTFQLNGRQVNNELSPYLFNAKTTKEYIDALRSGEPNLPQIIIELYLKKTDGLARLRGTINKKQEDVPGVSIKILFDEEYGEEYEEYIKEPDQVTAIPVEYYKIEWCDFAGNHLRKRLIPINVSLIDTTTIRLQSGSDAYMRSIINDSLDIKERTKLTLTYRGLKESFAEEDSIKAINNKLSKDKGVLSDKKFSVSIDISQKSSWETSLTPYLDEIPFGYIGKGEQSKIKMNLALETDAIESQLILIEEPENHLSFANMNLLIKKIQEKCEGKQIIITTHSAFVLNKLGIEKVTMLAKSVPGVSLKNLSKDTWKFFKKLPGYGTLRLILARKSILVEGSSDELVVKRAFMETHGRLPIEMGIDVIPVGLSAPRFLDIAVLLKKEVIVVTDNDGDVQALEKRYMKYQVHKSHLKICYGANPKLNTLEPQIVDVNDLKTMNKVLGRNDQNISETLKYMTNNKAAAALKIFESEIAIKFPKYVSDAVK